MKNYNFLLFLFLIVVVVACKKMDTLPDNLFLTTQAEVDAFNYTSLPGNLTIMGEVISDLTSLKKLTHIKGNLFIRNNDFLASLSGLENLTVIDSGLVISDNYALASLEGLKGLTKVGDGIAIVGNRLLTSMKGLNSLTDFKGLINISHNEKLETLEGLRISTISFLYVYNNIALFDFCAIRSSVLIINQSGISIANNGYNPTYQQFIDGQCSH